MLGLYLLTTTLLDVMKVIKFGMSMRLEFRWIDYLSIFADSKYDYYYEFLDDYSRTYILEIENEIIQIHQNKRNKYFQTEYFNCDDKKEFHKTIIMVLDKNKIKYKIHSEHNFEREYYDNKPDPLGKNSFSEKQIIPNNEFKPYEEQQLIINKAYNYFQENDKGLLILTCGVGKTLISLWISSKLDTTTILVGVPNKLLLKQWSIEIKKVFPNINYLLVKGGTKVEEINYFLKNNVSNKKCIITTYSSCHKILIATKEINFKFDMKINDECHHLTSKLLNKNFIFCLTSSDIKLEQTKTFIEMLNIDSTKQLSLTATIKNVESNIINDNIISNDNINYFGEIIDRKCLLWAINKELICDYIIQTIITDDKKLESTFEKFNIIEETDKRLFLSAYTTLKSISNGISHRLLIYSNNMDNSIKLVEYIKLLLENKYFIIPELYYSSYNSNMKSKDQQHILKMFEEIKLGIITCVYCLGEGWDFPLLDGVVISENMTANIRIVQSVLRASRKNKKDPNKITKIILPILNIHTWLDNDNNDLKKVREVIYQMGLEDETIMSKIKVYKIGIYNNNKKNTSNIYIDNFGEYDEELTKLLRLRTIPRYALDITYEKACKIISEKNIKGINKQVYYELCNMDIRLPINPEEIFKGKFDWIDYLSISKIYYDLDKCIKMIKLYLLENPDIKKYYLDLAIINEKLCELDCNFPPYNLWVEYYKVKEISDIIKITDKQRKPNIII
jgi:predicted helicase